mgnify:FL=1
MAKHLLFFFLDGVGLGAGDPGSNPFCGYDMPALIKLLDGHRLLASDFSPQPRHSDRASWLALDACLGVPGLPQSATGQATLLTGLNIPSLVGGHDGPKPSPAVASYLRNGSLFTKLQNTGHTTALLNAYPPRYFEAIKSGYRLPGAIAMAALHAGMTLNTTLELKSGNALSADFTGQGWQDHLGIPGVPVITARTAGNRMAQLASGYAFGIFEFWLSDVLGHRQQMPPAREVLATLDEVITGLIEIWNDQDGLILITSDHGNLEDLSTRRHTANPVPLVLIGSIQHRLHFLDGMGKANPGSIYDLTRVAPAIIQFLG